MPTTFLSTEFIQQVKSSSEYFFSSFFSKIYAHENRAVMWNVWKNSMLTGNFWLLWRNMYDYSQDYVKHCMWCCGGNHVRNAKLRKRNTWERNHARMREKKQERSYMQQGAITLHNLRADKHAKEPKSTQLRELSQNSLESDINTAFSSHKSH